MKPMLRLLRDAEDFELQLVVTDQHVSQRFGNTIEEVRVDFEISAAVDMEQDGDTPLARSRALGVCQFKMSEVMAELDPDICLLYGDRGEVLSTAMVATTFGIPIGHIQGGDVSGSVDEQVRHALTKLSHIHFPSTDESADRIIKLGEEPSRVHVVGDNHIDLIVAGEYADASTVEAALNIDLTQPVIVVLQHSETTRPDDSYAQMAETLAAVDRFGLQTVVVHPCSDVGYGGIIKAINEMTSAPNYHVAVNLDASIFWGLLARCAVMVGNSSAGLIETPSFRLPAVNIGRRQNNRLCAENVLHVGHDRDRIAEAVHKALDDSAFQATVANCRQIYGDGHAGERIINVLRNLDISPELLVKNMTY